jgi:uncharacterized protein (TIGR01244 family)
MSLSDIYNFVQIDQRTATAGQPSAAQFSEIARAGYEVVINLAPDGLQTSLADERALLSDLGLEYHHIPVAWDSPRFSDLDQFETLMDSLAERSTFIHCQANYRVSAFFALYAMAKLNWSDR